MVDDSEEQLTSGNGGNGRPYRKRLFEQTQAHTGIKIYKPLYHFADSYK